MDVFIMTLENMAVYLAFFAAGLFFSKKHYLPDDSGKTLSFLITNLFTPAISFNTFAQKFTVAKIGEYATMLIAGCVFLVLSVLTAEVVRHLTPGNRFDKLTAHYSVVVPNYGNMGYPLVLALFGQEVLSKFMMFALPFNFYVFGYMMPQYMPSKAGRGAMLKKIFSAPIVMMLVGMVYGLSGLKYPNLFETFCSAASDCLAPASFLVVGLAMGKRTLLPYFREPRAYALTAMRLLLLPAIVIFGAYFLCRNTPLPAEVLMIVGIYASMPMGSNPVIFAEAYGGDGSLGASCALISMLSALITLPFARLLIEHLLTLL